MMETLITMKITPLYFQGQVKYIDLSKRTVLVPSPDKMDLGVIMRIDEIYIKMLVRYNRKK
jgi:hypothetical protein